MERRRAVIAAATASLTLLAGAAAISINTGIVGASGDGDVGRIQPIDVTTSSGSGSVDVPSADEGRTRTATTLEDREGDDRYDDGTRGDDDRYDDHEGDAHEYEGADDDD